MSMDLADLIKINDRNLYQVEGITDLLEDAPFLAALPGDSASNGTVHKYLKQTGAPTVGFRAVNTGRAMSKSTDTEVTQNLQVLDASWDVDVALATEYIRGEPAFMMRETNRHLKTAFSVAEQQIFYGIADGDALGFQGLTDVLNDLLNDKVIDGGGTTSSDKHSCYLFRTGRMDFQAIMGNRGNIDVMPTVVQQKEGPTPDTFFPAYYTPITGWMAVQFGSIHSVVRIANLDDSNPLTDALIYQALEQFPAARQPTIIVTNRKGQEQIRASRTATNTTGFPAPRPMDVEGFPLITTDSLRTNEAPVT